MNVKPKISKFLTKGLSGESVTEQTQEQRAQNERMSAAIEAIKAEFPNMGVILITANALGGFSYSSNVATTHMSGILRHIVDHIDGKCGCS